MIAERIDDLEKSFQQLKIYSCLNLYVEELEEGTAPTKWELEFEKDKYRCTITFNDPRKQAEVPDYTFEISMDTRQTLQELKERVADIVFFLSVLTFLARARFRGVSHEARNSVQP